MAKFVVIGERIHCISPVIREAMNTMNPEPILKRAEEQLKAGATYLAVKARDPPAAHICPNESFHSLLKARLLRI